MTLFYFCREKYDILIDESGKYIFYLSLICFDHKSLRYFDHGVFVSYLQNLKCEKSQINCCIMHWFKLTYIYKIHWNLYGKSLLGVLVNWLFAWINPCPRQWFNVVVVVKLWFKACKGNLFFVTFFVLKASHHP